MPFLQQSDESGTRRDESGTRRDGPAARWDASAARGAAYPAHQPSHANCSGQPFATRWARQPYSKTPPGRASCDALPGVSSQMPRRATVSERGDGGASASIPRHIPPPTTRTLAKIGRSPQSMEWRACLSLSVSHYVYVGRATRAGTQRLFTCRGCLQEESLCTRTWLCTQRPHNSAQMP